MALNSVHLGSEIAGRKLEQLVENKTSFSGNHADLHLYETHVEANAVELQFGVPVLTSMISGKKVMHLQGMAPLDYLPGESLILPSNEPMRIDFPEASEQSPTKCLALAISPDVIRDTVQHLNENMPKPEEEGGWRLQEGNFHFLNDRGVAAVLNRMLGVYLEGNRARDIFVDFCLRELLIRLLQTQARSVLIHQYSNYQHSHRMAYVAKYVKENLDRNLTVKELANQACMSEPTFFRTFKQEFGLTPVEFIIGERLEKAKELLRQEEMSVTEVALACGFNNMSYFISQFKKQEASTPHQWRRQQLF